MRPEDRRRMINAAIVVRFVSTAIGLVVGATGGFFIGLAFSSAEGFEELGAALTGALVVSPLGAIAGNLLGARILRRRGSVMAAPGAAASVGRGVLEGLGLTLGFVGGWVLSSMTGYGQSVPGLMNVVALGGGVLGFAAGASLADRIPSQARTDSRP